MEKNSLWGKNYQKVVLVLLVGGMLLENGVIVANNVTAATSNNT